MSQKILCEVSNCKFWRDENRCAAQSIYVVSTKGHQAETSEQTDCKTFRPRE